MNQVNTERLLKDMRAVLLDAEELLRATADQGGEQTEQLILAWRRGRSAGRRRFFLGIEQHHVAAARQRPQ